MKKWLMIWMLFCGSVGLHAASVDLSDDFAGPSFYDSVNNFESSEDIVGDISQNEATLSIKATVPTQNSNDILYFLLSDGSYWQVSSFIPRWKTIPEWWDQEKVAAENLECAPNEWHLDSVVRIYPKEGYIEQLEQDVYNTAELEQCTHLLVNSANGEMAFATLIPSVVSLGTLAFNVYDVAHAYGASKIGINPARSSLFFSDQAGSALGLTQFECEVPSSGVKGVLTQKATFQDADSYFVLSDGSCWEVFAFVKRVRTLREWWYNESLMPEEYNTTPNNWDLGTNLSIYRKEDYIAVDESNATNYDELEECAYLLVNEETKQVLFARPLDGTECLDRVYKDALCNGFYNGWHKIDANQSGSIDLDSSEGK